ncbi:MAG: alpha/beta hydrolase [Alphaproteobacteria bacterium HGW-Alphaproteobacteria-2]|nr:MAG: alpha/beta hydrolase [Alphaproteobacteria bacterium HGW-Alphaproteobacteria-2]
MAQTRVVLAGARALTGWQGPVALIGHSMASDIVVRAGLAEGAAAIVAISMYSEAVTEAGPANLLILSGEWEPGLRRVALDALRQVAPEAEEGETAAGPPRRRAAVAPDVEHLGVLYSPVTLAETRAWLDAAFGRAPGQGRLATTGGWIAALLLGIVLLGRVLVTATPPVPASAVLPARRFWMVALLPAVAVPLALRPLPTAFLPVLVADYLALHLLAYGALLLALSRGVPLRGAVWAGLALALWGIAVFGLSLDRYFSSFLPVAERLPVLAALLPGALAYALGEARALRGGQAPLWQALTLRGAFLGSLALAAALDFDRLMFLLIILPVMLAWFAIFATQAGWVGRRHGPLAAGLGAGAILAWTLGVTFPLFVR